MSWTLYIICQKWRKWFVSRCCKFFTNKTIQNAHQATRQFHDVILLDDIWKIDRTYIELARRYLDINKIPEIAMYI